MIIFAFSHIDMIFTDYFQTLKFLVMVLLTISIVVKEYIVSDIFTSLEIY